MRTIELVERIPTVSEYQEIVRSVGFRSQHSGSVEIALENTIFAVCAYERDRLVGMGRIVGDKAISFLLTNVLVVPTHQRQGIGSQMVENLCARMTKLPHQNMVLQVAPLPGLQEFYDRLGFSSSRDAPPGLVRWFNQQKS